MSRVERVESLLSQIEDETRMAFDEHTQLYHKAQSLESENAKLRELAETLWILMSVGPCNRSQLEWLDDRCDEIGRERPSDMVRELGIKGWPR